MLITDHQYIVDKLESNSSAVPESALLVAEPNFFHINPIKISISPICLVITACESSSIPGLKFSHFSTFKVIFLLYTPNTI